VIAHVSMPAALGDPLAWIWRPEILLPLLVLAGGYGLGQWRLARRASGTFVPWRSASWIVGLLGIAAALLSPLDLLAGTLFSAHMVQHLLLMLVAAPALLLASPFPALLWALPAGPRAAVGSLLAPGARLRRLWSALTSPAAAWLLYALVLWLWHLPAAYEAALASRLVHDLEHLAFFASALLFWWPIVAPAPRVRPPAPHGLRVVYLVLAAFQSGLLGLLLTLSPWALYPSYTRAARVWGVTAEADQALGGAIMWGAGGAIDMLAVLVLLHRHLAAADHPLGASSSGPRAPGGSSRPPVVTWARLSGRGRRSGRPGSRWSRPAPASALSRRAPRASAPPGPTSRPYDSGASGSGGHAARGRETP
jgi:cytochrome c oxidase assembly factor CtaG